MKNIFGIILIVGVIACISLIPLSAQNNLSVSYQSAANVPDFLNICGDPDDVSVTIEVEGFEATERTNITATLHLFEGTYLVDFNAANSSSGITLSDNSDPQHPIFSLPNLSPTGLSNIQIAYSMAANCNALDTLISNNALQVFDTWEFNYNLGNQTNLTETDATPEYRDAFSIPSFTTTMENDFGPTRVGDCFERTLVVNNSALDGFISEMYYTNRQGTGISVQNISINGVEIPIQKSVDFLGDTIISATITGDFFQNNTLGNGAGNGNNFFDPDETMHLTEQICVVDCNDLQSFHTVSWGCNSDICQVVSHPDFVPIGEGSANVIVQEEGSMLNENTGYCSVGQTTLTFTNNGAEFDEGFAGMIDVETGIGLGSGFVLSANGYTITGLRIAGVDVPNIDELNLLQNIPAFAGNPDGLGGLEDLDGDGFFDDLGLGESFEITAFYEFDCSLAQSNNLADNCTNDFAVSFNARVDYTNQCDERLIRLQPNFFRPANNNASFENFTDPDAFAELDTFYITHSESRTIRNFNIDCDGEEFFVASIALPQGVSPVISETKLFKNGITEVPLLDNSISNDTLYLTYDAAAINFLLGDYDLVMAFTADCNAEVGASVFPLTFELVCPPCDCRHIWFCDNLIGPQIHATNPPCDEATACDEGIQTTNFEVNRTTFGFTDNTYTTPINPDNANKKVGIACDLVQMTVANLVGAMAISDNIGVVIQYENVDGSDNLEETFLFENAFARITHNGATFTCPLTSDQLIIENTGLEKILTFDLSSCLTESNVTLGNGDIVEFVGNFSINPNGPYLVQFRKIPALRGFGYIENNGEQIICDSYGENFTVAKNTTVFDSPSSNNFPEGCEITDLDYRLITVNNGFDDFFGDEFRRAVAIDSIQFNYDVAILDAFSDVTLEVSIPGHPIHGNSFFPLSPLTDFPLGTYVAHFDTLIRTPSYNQVQSYAFNLRWKVTPSCRSLNGSSNDDHIYTINPTIFYKDRFYANFIGNGDCAEEKEESSINNVSYSEPPTFSFTPFGVTNYLLSGDTATWTVQHCNTSFTADAGITWISVEDTTSSIFVVSMEDITDVTNPVPLEVQVYGDNGYFAFTPGLVRANGQNLLEDICNVIRIKATVKNCGQTFFPVDAGWNCAPYEDNTWNPDDNPPCEEQSVQLSVTPLEPFLDANIIEQPITSPEICEDNTITILLRNTDLGTAFNIRSRLNLPQGATLVPGSVEFAYPSNTDFQAALSDPILVADNDAGKIYEYEDFSQLNAILNESGLSGFNAGNPNSENEFRLKFRFTTDCDFVSGSLLFYNFQGIKGCGEPSNFEAGETIPMVIAGTESDFSKLLHVEFTENSSLAPGGIGSVAVEITNLTTTATDNADFLTLTLPVGVTYVENTTNATIPDTWQADEPDITIDNDGRQVLNWPLPIGLEQNDNALLNFDLNAPDLDCEIETVDVILRTFSTESLLCETTNETCEVVTTTSTTGNTLTPLAANLGLLEFVINSIESTCANESQEAVTVTGTLQSLGAELENETMTIHYHFDENGNGFYDEGEAEIASFDEIGTVLPNSPLSFNHTFDVNIEQVCMMLIRLDESSFSSLCGKVEAPLDAPQLQNAGIDDSFCVLSNVPTTFNLGVGSCTNINYDFTWSAVPETAIDNLSDIKVPQPALTITHEGAVPLELMYILQTSRPNCSFSFDTITITINEQPNIDAGFDQTICAGETTRLNAFVNDGAMPYNVTWTPPVESGINSLEPVVSPTETTDYIFTILDNNNCEISDTIRVNVNSCDCTPPVVTSVSTTASTCGNAEGTATIMVDGNAADYNYIWSPDEGTTMGNVRTNLPFGGYEVTIISNNDPSCTTTTSVLITNADGPNATATTSPVSCDGTLGTVSLTPTEFNYIWPDDSTESTRDNLNPGSYFVTFTDPADEDCPNVLEVIIELNNTLEAELIVSTHPTCGNSNGSVSINVSGGSGDYNFSWTGGTNTQENLAGGIHAVTITDNGGACELEFLFVLTDEVPQANIDNIELQHVDCFNDENGGLTFDITTEEDFTPPSDTIFSNGLQIFENGAFPAGNICIVIMDGNNCVAGGECFTILEPEPLQVNLNTTLSCENDGTISAQISGGTAPYTINWEDLIGNDNAIERADLAPGTYNVVVTDQNNCSVTSTAIVQGCNCEPALINNIAITEAACTLSNGAATIHVQGEESDYSYHWTPDIGMSNELGNAKTNLPFGAYQVEIINVDNPTCAIAISILITNEDAPSATAIVTPASCQQADGTAILSPSNYTYQWSDGEMGSGRMDLRAGTYTVTLADPAAPDCPNVMEVVVPLSNPLAAELVVNTRPTCEQSNGSVTLNVTGGSGDYSYSWPSNTNTQDNIAAGIYTVTITDNSPFGCELPYIFVLTDEVENINILNLTTTNVSCPGNADGSVDYSLVFNPTVTDTSDIIISNGIQIFENGSLPAGDFCLAISDDNDCIAGGICFTIETPEPLDIDLILSPECETGGSIDVSVSGGTAPYSFDWLDLEGTDNPGDRTDLTVGDYVFVVTDALGCSLMSDDIRIDTCVVCDIFVDVDTLILQAPNCDTEAKLCFDLAPDEVGRYRITDNGEVYTDFLDRCEFDTLGVYTYATLLSVPGPYQLLSWEVNDLVFSGEFADIPALVDSMNTWDPNGNWSLSSDGPFILGGFPSHTYDQMDVEVVSLGITSFLGYNLGFFPNGYAIPLELGPHEVIFTDTTTGCEEIIFVEVVCTTPDTIPLTVVETMSDTLCFSGEELLGSIDTIYNDCPDDFFVTTEVLGDSCIIFTGITPGNSTACIVLCDEYDVCDTTYVLVTIESLIDETIKDTIVIDQSVEYCFDIDSLDLLGELTTIDNICPELSNGTVDFDINDDSFCVVYTGVELGTDTACIQLCDDLGNCDTIPFQITVVNGLVVVDTIFINVDTVTYCFDDIVDGTIVSIEDGCPENNGDEVIFSIDPLTNCVIYTGIAIGTDTACIWITNDVGDMSLVTFFVTVKETTTEYIRDTIFINQNEMYCADMSELPGELDFIDNFCPEESGEFVDFFTNPTTFCIEYSGLEIGTDSACIVFCDDLGYCDTAFITVTVVEYFEPPIATNDTTQTLRDTPVVIDVKSNDTIYGGLVGTPYILDAPLYGEAQFNLDCSITYTPDERYCERTDMFTYVICNPNGCDTATVFVFIECVGVVVFNAVSPNKDGFNDVFYIFGLDDKPDNVLEIYNRWGNLVYKTTNYQNTWAGTWDNNKELPDGTYFYILEYLDEEGKTVKLNGYLELYR